MLFLLLYYAVILNSKTKPPRVFKIRPFDSHSGTNTHYRIKKLSKVNQLKVSRSESGLVLAQMSNCTEFCEARLNIT